MQAGIYLGKHITAGTAKSGEKQTPYLYIEMLVEYVAENGQWSPIEPVKRDLRFWLSEKAWDVSMRDLKTLGFNGDLENPKFAPEVYTGINMECTLEEYNGKQQERWGLPYNRTLERVEMDRAEVRTLQARLSQEFNKRPATAPPAAPVAAPTPPVHTPGDTHAEDSLPF
jgi:hypothetical protein